MQERRIDDYWNVDGSRDLSDSWTGFTQFRSDIVKDDSGSYAVFTEQGSSASQMTAAEVMDIITRLPGCAGLAADAVSAYTQVKMEDAPSLFVQKIRSQNVQIFGFVYQSTNGQNHEDCVWESHYQVIMKTILQEKEKVHYSITIWFTNLSLCSSYENSCSKKQRWARNGKNWRKFRRGN